MRPQALCQDIPKVIYAARVPEDVLAAVEGAEPSWVFLLGGNGSEVLGASRALRERGFAVFVHIDMCHGIKNDAEGIALLSSLGRPSGIITTHPSAVVAAKKLGLMTIERIFLLDSASVESGMRNVARTTPDVVEVLPGILPAQIAMMKHALEMPLIAGGLITQLSQIQAALEAGACGVSTSSQGLIAEARGLL